jgi:hypothetical protein
MNDWFKKLIADKDGNPNEHIVAALWGSVVLAIITLVMCYTGHYPTLSDFGIAHGAVWTAAGAGQKLSGGS